MRHLRSFTIYFSAICALALFAGCGGEETEGEISVQKQAGWLGPCGYVGQLFGTFTFTDTNTGFCLADKGRKSVFGNDMLTIEKCKSVNKIRWNLYCQTVAREAEFSVCNAQTGRCMDTTPENLNGNIFPSYTPENMKLYVVTGSNIIFVFPSVYYPQDRVGQAGCVFGGGGTYEYCEIARNYSVYSEIIFLMTAL